MDGHSPINPDLCARFDVVRARTSALAGPLSAEDCQIQSMPDASPVKWHLAHTTWFWETFLLKPYLDGYQTPDEAFNFLFNSYYEAVGPRHARPQRGMITRPSLSEVQAYRQHVDAAMRSLIEQDCEPHMELIELGLAHEEQHQELLLTDLKHAFSQNPLFPAAYDAPLLAQIVAGPEGWASFEGGLVEIGHKGDGFHFDNEGPHHKVWLEPFDLARGLVTNEDVLDFMADGGYRLPSLWLSDGWALAQAEGWEAPLYWQRAEQDDLGWKTYTLAGLRALDLAAPAQHLSFYEAAAIAEWTGYRMPTEAEWEHAALTTPDTLANLDGAVWQWTRSDYAPYPGYRAPAGAVGEYNGKFMSGQYVLRGSSAATASGHSRATYRNFFPAHARWQFSGLRLARDV